MQGLLIERIKTYFRQVREKMSTFDAYFTRGGELYNEKKYNLAVEFFKIALRQSNAENYAYYNLALAYQQLELDDKALENYKILNRAIFHSILGRFSVSDLLDANLFELVRVIISGTYALPGLLNEYIEYMNKHYFEMKKVKDLRYPYASRM